MLTPQEIQDKKFEKAMFGGYDMGQIDHFLDEVLGDYTSLYKENATLKAKMRVLVDKIEEYRAVDEEMRKTLYTAQVTAKDMVDKAQAQAEGLLSDARKEADHQLAEMRTEIEAEEKRLQEARKANATYINKIKEAMRRNIELMDSILDIPQQELLKQAQPPKGRPAPRDDFEVVLPDEVMEPAKAQAAPMPASLPRTEPAIAGIAGTEPDDPVAVVAQAVAAAQIAQAAHLAEAAVPAAPTATGGARLAQPQTAEAYITPQEPGLSEMETRFFDVELGGAQPSAPEDEEGDTAKIYGDATFTPKPRFDFSDIRFGKDYTDDNE